MTTERIDVLSSSRTIYAVRDESGELWARYLYQQMAEAVANRMTNEGAGKIYTAHQEEETEGDVVSYAKPECAALASVGGA